VSFRERIGHAKDLLTDRAKTAFFFVTLPEALPIAVIKRFVNWFTEFGIPVGGVVVNEVIEPPSEGAPEFVRNRVAMQREYLEQIGRDFEGQVRAVLPLLDDEVRGVDRLRELARALFE
jgi:arsenite-transporting ATPase